MKHVVSPELSIYSHARHIIDNLDINESSRKEYAYRIRLFLDYIRKQGFNKNSYLDFKRYLQARNDLSISSKCKYLVVSKVYCKELHRQGLIPIDISSGIKSFRQSHQHKKEGLSDYEVTAVINHLHQLSLNSQNLRLKAVISLLCIQGLRQIEIVRLDVRDLDLISMTALIQGKGEDDKKIVNLLPETVSILRLYLSSNKIADGALFVSRSNHGYNQRLTTRGLRTIVKSILSKLQINKCVHGFRHNYVTRLIRAYKSDLMMVSKYTRHKTLQMLTIYNDTILQKADLPRLYKVFQELEF